MDSAAEVDDEAEAATESETESGTTESETESGTTEGATESETTEDATGTEDESGTQGESETESGSETGTESESDTGLVEVDCNGPIHVDRDAPPSGDGSTWAKAIDDLQLAIDSAQSCLLPELWVAEGIYMDDAAMPVATISSDMRLYGGFAGDEQELAQRDWLAHPTVLGQAGMSTSVVVLDLDDVETLLLDGFEITGGSASYGGGLYAINPDAWETHHTFDLANMYFHDNHAEANGGAMWLPIWARANIVASRFEDNTSDGSGGAIALDHGHADISQSRFTSNHATGDGGAINVMPQINTNYGIVHADASEFVGNTSGGSGGATAGVEANLFTNTHFEANEAAGYGGAISITDEGIVGDSTFFANYAGSGCGAVAILHGEVQHSAFVDNSSDGAGGAVCAGEGAGPPVLAYLTFAENSAAGDGGALAFGTSGTTVTDSIFVRNEAGGSGGGVWGASYIRRCSFDDNQAAVEGDHVGHGDMGPVVEHDVAWPQPLLLDPQETPNFWVTESCVTDTNASYTSDLVILDSDPFVETDVDLDGVPELELLPNSPCMGWGAP